MSINTFKVGLRNGMSVAARAQGVNYYPLRLEGLMVVRRPIKWNHIAAMAWFYRVAQGQKYDWLGLLSFVLARNMKSPNKMFCSELARNIDTPAETMPFDSDWQGDETPPPFFLVSPALTTMYRKKRGVNLLR